MIRVEGVRYRAGRFGLDDVSFAVGAGSYGVLMGATGCGKTTLLEIICGLREVEAGVVMVGEQDVTGEPPGRRGVGYVPQDGALFPAMRVREQIAFALRLRRWASADIEARVGELAGQLQIAHLLDRKPAGLSGGEGQRVALARALAARPAVLLLDEPLSALDDTTREQTAVLLKETQRAQGVTALHVTHSLREAGQLADVLLQMEAGQVRSAAPV
ncbi:MAG: ATP-binding cassette domain-containing protein [Armatimonadetes bacterium]|nr:ATP-binding cassette domain-containing protein [Armatimonadota bacterium]